VAGENPTVSGVAGRYATALFERATVERYLGYWMRLLEGMVADAVQQVDRLPLLTEAEQDQVLVFVCNRGPNPHVAQDGLHHARWKFLRCGVTAAAVGAKTPLTLESHVLGVVILHDSCARSNLAAGGRSGEDGRCEGESPEQHRKPIPRLEISLHSVPTRPSGIAKR